MKTKLLAGLCLLFSGISSAQITDPAPYCVFNAWGAAPIDNIQLEALDHNPAYDWATTMYNYYNDVPVPDIVIGEATPMSITFGDAIDGEPQIFGVYIDFNNDNVFSPDEDLMNNWTTGGGFLPCFAGTTEERNGTITVPLTATPGITRMRVVRAHLIPFDWGAPPPGPGDQAACCNPGTDMMDTEYSYGSAVDYDVNLVADGPVDLKALFTPENSTICIDDELTFTDASLSEDGVTAWNWTFDGGEPAVAATEGPHTVSFDTPGVYDVTLEVTDATGTHDTTFVITVEDCDEIEASIVPVNTEICKGDCIEFIDASTGAGIIGYAWTFSDPDIAGPILEAETGEVCFNNPGDHTVTLTVTNGAITDDTTITITVRPNPVVTAEAVPGTDLCEGEELRLNGGGAETYVWSGGVMDGEVFVPLATETYVVVGTDEFGCMGEAEITVTVSPCEPVEAAFELPAIICVGDCITFEDQSSGTPISWNWDFGGGGTPAVSEEPNPTICFETAGIYDIQLTVENAAGDVSATTNSITVMDVPVIHVEQDTIIELGESAQLLVTGGDGTGTYLWTPNDDLGCDDCDWLTASPAEDRTYYVTYTSINGCTATDSVRVLVNFRESVDVPTAFSPNGDGANDILFVKGYGIEQVYFAIYNRYGEMVFETYDQKIGWDGTFRGREENPGVFFWKLNYNLEDGNSGEKKGNTTLVR